MDKLKFFELRQKVIDAGYGEEIIWQESVTCDSADEFMRQYIWVVISSGIKNQVATVIEQRVIDARNKGKPIEAAFGHKGKVAAIKYMIRNHRRLFEEYLNSKEPLEYLVSLPYIGNITKYHLAKNLGLDVAKPDRHLVRIATEYGMTPDELCGKLAGETGYRKATVDYIIWRVANLGFI